MAAQFRRHVLSMLVFPRYARLLIWDRVGVTVTEKIDLETNASVLADFFWQYQNMSRTQCYIGVIVIMGGSPISSILLGLPSSLT